MHLSYRIIVQFRLLSSEPPLWDIDLSKHPAVSNTGVPCDRHLESTADEVCHLNIFRLPAVDGTLFASPASVLLISELVFPESPPWTSRKQSADQCKVCIFILLQSDIIEIQVKLFLRTSVFLWFSQVHKIGTQSIFKHDCTVGLVAVFQRAVPRPVALKSLREMLQN